MSKKNLIIHGVFFCLLLFPINCQKSKRHEDVFNRASPQETDSQENLGQGMGRGIGRQPGLKAVGRGYGRRGFGRNGRVWAEGDSVSLTDEEKAMVEIETVAAATKPLRSQLQAMGKILAHPQRKAIVSYAFPARVAQIHVRIGDWINPGQRLVTLQSEEVGNAKSEFYKAKADYELAKLNFEREKRLYDRGVGAKKDSLSTEAELKVAEATLNAAEKKLHVLGFTEDQVKTISETHQINPVISLYAPLSGKIITNNAVLGAMVDQGSEILTIMDPNLLCVDAEIYERDIAKIRNDQGVEVTVPAFQGETFGGKICYISDVLNEDTRTITVRSEVTNRDFKLKPGMFADIKIFLNHQTQALVLPQEAILEEKGEQMVFIESEGKYFPRIIRTGSRENDHVEILNGIQEGEMVVTKGNYQLKSKLYDEILKKGHVH